MRNLRIYVGVIALGVFFFSFTELKKNRIKWNAGKTVNWNDYEGIPDYADNFRDAVTASALNYNVRCHTDGNLTVSVSAEFLKDQSWVKERARTDYHLGHERLHFDITELFARKMRKTFEGQQFRCEDEAVVHQLATQLLAEWREAQVQYDKETLYSLDKHDQKLWHQKVANDMIEHDHYASE
ncbi:MAG: hypothetical protein KTR13_07930 [Saprospiraceae bacterium]|nr:hypothetical protein [Saprospiraceae bacterium]